MNLLMSQALRHTNEVEQFTRQNRNQYGCSYSWRLTHPLLKKGGGEVPLDHQGGIIQPL